MVIWKVNTHTHTFGESFKNPWIGLRNIVFQKLIFRVPCQFLYWVHLYVLNLILGDAPALSQLRQESFKSKPMTINEWAMAGLSWNSPFGCGATIIRVPPLVERRSRCPKLERKSTSSQDETSPQRINDIMIHVILHTCPRTLAQRTRMSCSCGLKARLLTHK